MANGDVMRSLASGLVAYAMIVACSSGGGDGGKVENTGGVTGMNGNAGESSSGGANGTGAVAMAATGGDTSGACECPEPEADVIFEAECTETFQTAQWAVLSVPGATADDLMRVTARTFKKNGDSSGAPDLPSIQALTATGDGVVKAQCTGATRFRLPADLAAKVAQ